MATYIIAASFGNNPVSHYFFGLGEEFARRGHEVVMLVDGQRTDAQRAGNPRVLTWPSRRPTRPKDALFLRHLIRETRPSAIIANFGSVTVSMLVGAVSGVSARIAWYHTLSRQISQDNPVHILKRRLLQLRKKTVYRFATQVVAVSTAAVEDARAAYDIPADKSRALPLLLRDPYSPGVARAPARIVCVGRLFPSKGQATLIRALPEVALAFPRITAVFLGEGPSREDYLKLAASLGVADRCDFPGWQPLEKVHEELQSSTLAVVASLSEAFGLAPVEAQALGTPLIATNTDGIRETVVDGESGLLVPPGDPQALARKIIAVLKDPSLRNRLSETARQHFLSTFSISEIGMHANIIEGLITKSGPTG